VKYENELTGMDVLPAQFCTLVGERGSGRRSGVEEFGRQVFADMLMVNGVRVDIERATGCGFVLDRVGGGHGSHLYVRQGGRRGGGSRHGDDRSAEECESKEMRDEHIRRYPSGELWNGLSSTDLAAL
jgi:hypothetical protein